MRRLAYAFATILMVSLYLGLAVWADGGWTAFFSHPALGGLVAVAFVFAFASTLTPATLSPGVREDRANRWVIPAYGAVNLVSGFLPAWTDRRGLWVVDGEAVRWAGLAVFAIGCTLRLAPVYTLGRRFSGLVAIQPGHQLETRGLYAIVRNPSYVGALLVILGWGFAFRALIGVILTLLLVPVLVARIHAEERLLASQFGEAYEAYRARSWRLIPWVY